MNNMQFFNTWYEEKKEEILSNYFTFLRFPSISTDPAHSADMRSTATWVFSYLKNIGLDVKMWETVNHPTVFAVKYSKNPKAQTLLLYHHYDVQPAVPLERWTSFPFEPEVRENQVYARGAQDNKGQCFYTLTAIQAFLSQHEDLGFHIKILIEGAEEIGSDSTAQILPEHQKELKADFLLVVDMGIPNPKTPAITLGMRGIMTMEVVCENGVADLHSGAHGGIALNPLRVLSSMIASFWDEKGRVQVPGFYEGIIEISEEEKKRLALDFDLELYQAESGVRALCPEEPFTPLETNWLRPVLEINGLSGGYTGAGFKTVLPYQGVAKISARLVPGQNPREIFEKIKQFLEKQKPEGVQLFFSYHGGGPAFRNSCCAPIVQVVAKAYEEVLKDRCVFLLSGGSVPIVDDLARISGAQGILMGYGLACDNIHAPNEHFGLDRFKNGFLTMCAIFSRFSNSAGSVNSSSSIL